MKWKLGNNFYSSRLQIFNPRDLKSDQVQEEIKNHKYHIYLICKRPKLIFLKCDTSNEVYNLSVFYYLNETHDKIEITKKHSKELVVNSVDKGYANITTPQGLFEVRDFLLINSLWYLEKDLIGKTIGEKIPSDLEVMYVGQAFGRKTRKKIDYRISKHEKILDVAYEIMDNCTLDEILIIGVCIESSDIATSFVSLDSKDKKISVQDLLNLQQSAAKRVPEGQEVTLFEASLIAYFRPKYNSEHKDTFPTLDYGTYDEIFKTDFDYVNMTIDTKPIAARIHSEYIKTPLYIHNQDYSLKTEEEKKNLFDCLFEQE